MTDLRAWAARWNQASLRQLAAARRPAPSPWSTIGAFAVGLLAGALGYYAVTQRSEIKGLATRAFKARAEWLGEAGRVESAKQVATKYNRSNHRRKAVAEGT